MEPEESTPKDLVRIEVDPVKIEVDSQSESSIVYPTYLNLKVKLIMKKRVKVPTRTISKTRLRIQKKILNIKLDQKKAY